MIDIDRIIHLAARGDEAAKAELERELRRRGLDRPCLIAPRRPDERDAWPAPYDRPERADQAWRLWVAQILPATTSTASSLLERAPERTAGHEAETPLALAAAWADSMNWACGGAAWLVPSNINDIEWLDAACRLAYDCYPSNATGIREWGGARPLLEHESCTGGTRLRITAGRVEIVVHPRWVEDYSRREIRTIDLGSGPSPTLRLVWEPDGESSIRAEGPWYRWDCLDPSGVGQRLIEADRMTAGRISVALGRPIDEAIRSAVDELIGDRYQRLAAELGAEGW